MNQTQEDSLAELSRLAGDDFVRRIEVEKLRLEREKLVADERKAARGDRWLVRLFPIVVSAAATVVGIAISVAQVSSASIERRSVQRLAELRFGEERAAAAINADRQWRMTLLDIVSKNFDRIVSQDPEHRDVIRAALNTALTDSLAQRVFSGFATATKGEVSVGWQNATRDVEARIDDRQRRASQLIASLFAADAPARTAAGAEIIRGWRSSPEFAAQMIAYARQHRDNGNGIFNVVAMLDNMETATLRSIRGPVLGFLQEAEANGERTRQLSRQVQRRLVGES
jgi:hypothetical protein